MTDYDYKVDTCGWKNCNEKFHEPNNENALGIVLDGGYGDFIDNLFDPPVYFKLCHYHAHKFEKNIKNDRLSEGHAHPHGSKDKGQWYGHKAWDNYTWLCYVNEFFDSWYRYNLSSAITAVKNKFSLHKTWCRYDINDKTTPVNKKKFIFRLLFDNWNSKMKVYLR